MDAPHPITPTVAVGRTLLVGPGGDVILVDLGSAGADPVEVTRRVSELVGSGVAVAVQGVGPAAAVAAAEAGAVVLVGGGSGASGVEGATALAEAGVPVERLLVEVPFGAGSMPTSAIHRVTDAGFEVAVVLQPPHQAAGSHDGWQIGALAQVLALDVAAVRGVAPERFRRVAAVVAAIDSARADGQGARP
ncbi:hypothetical protein BH10ACT1_BH10ACT1_29330 [soil metagenome]